MSRKRVVGVEEAKALLSPTEENRPLGEGTVEKLAADVAAGKWKIEGMDPIPSRERMRQVYEEQCRGVSNPLPFEEWYEQMTGRPVK